MFEHLLQGREPAVQAMSASRRTLAAAGWVCALLLAPPTWALGLSVPGGPAAESVRGAPADAAPGASPASPASPYGLSSPGGLSPGGAALGLGTGLGGSAQGAMPNPGQAVPALGVSNHPERRPAPAPSTSTTPSGASHD